MTIRRVTPDDGFNYIHTYFTKSPYHPDNVRLLYCKFKTHDGPGYICVLDTRTGSETVLASVANPDYHNAAQQNWCDNGNKIVYKKTTETIAVYDLATGVETEVTAQLSSYSDNSDYLLEVDGDFPLDEQHAMGLYLRDVRHLENRRRLVTIDELFSAHPACADIKNARIRLRLGGQISPDKKTVILYLVSRVGTLVRDYFLFDLASSRIVYHGPLGQHIMWHPNSRDIYSFVRSGKTLAGEFPERWGADPYLHPYGKLGRYDVETREFALVSDHRIEGSAHVSPSPDGTKVAIDSIRYRGMSILLFDIRSGEMNTICTHDNFLRERGCPAEKTRFAPTVGQYYAESARRLDKTDGALDARHEKSHIKVNPHPVFSPDGSRIVFNSNETEYCHIYEAVF